MLGVGRVGSGGVGRGGRKKKLVGGMGGGGSKGSVRDGVAVRMEAGV